MKAIRKISLAIDRTNRKTGRIVSWLCLALVVMMCFNVFSRYLLQMNLIWQQELIRFMHAIVFLAAASYTLLDDKHVRVDVLYNNLSNKAQAIVNLAGTILFLLPACLAITFFSYNFIIESWKIFEDSTEYNGMPGIFLLKTCIWFFTITLFMQGVSTILKSIVTLRN